MTNLYTKETESMNHDMENARKLSLDGWSVMPKEYGGIRYAGDANNAALISALEECVAWMDAPQRETDLSKAIVRAARAALRDADEAADKAAQPQRTLLGADCTAAAAPPEVGAKARRECTCAVNDSSSTTHYSECALVLDSFRRDEEQGDGSERGDSENQPGRSSIAEPSPPPKPQGVVVRIPDGGYFYVLAKEYSQLLTRCEWFEAKCKQLGGAQ